MKPFSFSTPLYSALVLGCLLFGAGAARAQDTSPPNVLFIVADDMRPALGSYGVPAVISPNLDRLASRGTAFLRAYCQQAICNPSRASVMTGLRPDSTGVFDLTTHFRDHVPDVVTLPQHFKQHGYHTQALGKIYHPAFHGKAIGSDLNDEKSWSVPIWMGSPRYYYSPLGEALTRAVYAEKTGKTGADLDDWKTDFLRSLATEAPDVPDSMLYDGELTDRSIAALKEWSTRPEEGRPPIFLAVGYLKPHLPFIAPKRYWDLYDPMRIPLPDPASSPVGVPEVAMQVAMRELRDSYPLDVRVSPATALPVDDWSTYTIPRKGQIPPEQVRRLYHGYYACISFIDAQIGRLLGALQRFGMAENTIVLFYGDHGFHLGEQGIWGKLTNFEIATRSPLIVSAPGAQGAGRSSQAIVELVDIYPSLCELAGLPLPAHLEGESFARVLDNPGLPGKAAALSQYPRGDIMGRSMRTDTLRFTVWPSGAATRGQVRYEWYDHRSDPAETRNLADIPDNLEKVKELAALLERRWRAAHQ